MRFRTIKTKKLEALVGTVYLTSGGTTEKIGAIHGAVKGGHLRDLQAALDRRRFVVARDSSTSLGATPLHVAVLLGHTDVVRYLGARFPETLHATDAHGRTPLHYAATIADNGHYYQMLLALGANPAVKDQMSHDAEYYLKNSEELSHKQLLKEIGASEDLVDSFSDKGKSLTPTRGEPAFWTEEGRYLAASLGDPLIKGLKEIAEKRPPDPIVYLATYLYNVANKNRSQESDVVLMKPERRGHLEAAPLPEDMEDRAESVQEEDTSENSALNRDEHGQSMLHFAAARPHGRNAVFQLLQETGLNAAYRDELYRTARDVAAQANLPDNIGDIDKWVMHLAANGQKEKLLELLLEGYDHIVDIEASDGRSIMDVVAQRNQTETLRFLRSVQDFEDTRESVHAALRNGNTNKAKELLQASEDGATLAVAKSYYGRCSLHVAVLAQDEEATAMLTRLYPATLRVGDNLERTALHYAMGVEKVEELSTILIRAGAKRVVKDLKGRQPSYYFMNKSDILRLQEDEESMKI